VRTEQWFPTASTCIFCHSAKYFWI